MKLKIKFKDDPECLIIDFTGELDSLQKFEESVKLALQHRNGGASVHLNNQDMVINLTEIVYTIRIKDEEQTSVPSGTQKSQSEREMLGEILEPIAYCEEMLTKERLSEDVITQVRHLCLTIRQNVDFIRTHFKNTTRISVSELNRSIDEIHHYVVFEIHRVEFWNDDARAMVGYGSLTKLNNRLRQVADLLNNR